MVRSIVMSYTYVALWISLSGAVSGGGEDPLCSCSAGGLPPRP